MTQKINLITTTPLRHNGNLNDSDQKIWDYLGNHNLQGSLLVPGTLHYVFTDGVVSILDTSGRLVEGDLIVRATRDAEEEIYQVASLIAHNGGRVTDPLAALVYPVGKLLPFVYRSGKVRMPRSHFAPLASFAITYIESEFQYPFIVKPQHGFGGEYVALIKNQNDWHEYSLSLPAATPVIVQEYIADIVAEYRVVVVQGNSLGVARKITDSVVKNAALGSYFEKIDDPEIAQYASYVASLQPGDVFGVDIARTKSGALYVIENNRSPVFDAFFDATKISVEAHIVGVLTSAA